MKKINYKLLLGLLLVCLSLEYLTSYVFDLNFKFSLGIIVGILVYMMIIKNKKSD